LAEVNFSLNRVLKSVTFEVSQVEMPPPREVERVVQVPSAVSERHASTAVFRAVLDAGVKDAFAKCGVAKSRKPMK